MQKVSILGLGWLGKPLAEQLISKGYEVKGSTTSSEKEVQLKEEGFKVCQIRFDPEPFGHSVDWFFDTDVLFINIPPQSRSKPSTFHPEQIRQVKALAEKAGVKKIIYISSTSVYPDENQLAKEEDHLTDNSNGNAALWEAEQELWRNKSYDLTVIRFGGLLGVDRIPGRYFRGKTEVVGDTPVNYIHREDAVRLVEWVLKEQLWNLTLNGVAPLHPKRKEVYERNAQDLGFDPPKSYAVSGKTNWKAISAEKILETGFTFKFPDPLQFEYYHD
ncbi:NAD(P)H-binding protein [Pararhodonellum marinum]|uniref:NAD(P)H-binding protein n=1 Tax=Pararhodonellum marinum TaxID=2755358 RepID=UPI00188FDABA|nr:NAD(P)H-binding protein [Pararhodonellum marinum]